MYAFLAFGGNLFLDDRGPAETITLAIAELCRHDVQLQATSRFYQTPCFPAGAGPDFINVVASVEYAGTLSDLLALCHGVEAQFGRTREARWSARTLDIDILAAGDQVVPDRATVQRWIDLGLDAQATTAPDQLLLPHPRMHERGFVLVPLAEIAPNWLHPILKLSAKEMEMALSDDEKAQIVPLSKVEFPN